MIKIDAGEFCLIEPSEIYAEQICEYRRDFLVRVERAEHEPPHDGTF